MEIIVPKEERYNGLDGLRAVASIGIILMHLLANGKYELGGFLFDSIIPSFTHFVYLFMIISSFSMCCGYYDKVTTGSITPSQFYSKRFAKVLPYFALLTAADLVISPSVESLYEAFANITCCFGLLPNARISVIGVGWFLGTVFVFYFMFPFFCYLISTKKRAWMTLLAAVLYHVLCKVYFFNEEHVLSGFVSRSNILYSGMFFVAGGLIYLYRETLVQWSIRLHWVFAIAALAAVAVCGFLDGNSFVNLVAYAVLLIYAMGCGEGTGLMNNAAVRFLSNISLEMYLGHMLVFRVIEKTGIQRLFKSDVLRYWVIAALTVSGTIIFAVTAQWVLTKGKEWIVSKRSAAKKAAQ